MNITTPDGKFICTMCMQVVDIDSLEDTPSMEELLISGLCMDCQLKTYDPVAAAAPCCQMHTDLGYIDQDCVSLIMVDAGLEYEPTSKNERDQEALSCERHTFEYFSTDERWSLEMTFRAAHRKCHYTDPCLNKG